MDRLALKRLTASDLTFFKWHHENVPAGNQKAINLSRNVFIDRLYPSLPDRLSEKGDIKIPVTLVLLGPGLNGEYTLQRKILKSASYKNWRLNGEFIYPPADNPERYNILKPDDIAVMGFEGLTEPKAVYIDFISSEVEYDRDLHPLLSNKIDNKRGGMKEISGTELESIINTAGVPDEHPINKYVLSNDMIEVVQGSAEAQLRVYRRSGRTMSQDRLRAARLKAEHIGNMGEELIAAYLSCKLENSEINDFTWASRINAIAPYDFETVSLENVKTLIDVKTTTGAFSTNLHISMAEIETMALENEYVIYRVFDITDTGGKLRISMPMRQYALDVKETFHSLPEGTKVDSISCNPDCIGFGPVIEMSFDES